MKIEKKISIFMGFVVLFIAILGLVDRAPSKLTVYEFQNNCHTTNTC